jgi:hypothetical protein
MPLTERGPPLWDRVSERRVLDRLGTDVRDGRGQSLVLRGEPGVGKTALLRYLVHNSPGCRFVSAAGVESEMELPFAGLHQLCASFIDRAGALPQPQRDAIDVAFGLKAGDAPDGFLIGLAVLSLMSSVSEEQPLVFIVDDAHWLDDASMRTLAFVARRLHAERVGMVFALRELSSNPELSQLPELRVVGLSDSDARSLLESVTVVPLD